MAHGLPRLPIEEEPAKAQVVQFGGLNYGQSTRPGELEDCQNLSAKEFPCLSQRMGRETVSGHSGVQAIYDHFGKLVVVKGNKLYVDGTFVCDVTSAEKQFAPVNSQLVVWPDKIVVDVEEKKAVQMNASVTTYDHASSVMTENSITAPVRAVLQTECGGVALLDAWIFSYGKDLTAFFACWTGTAWDMDKLSALAGTAKKVEEVECGEIVFFRANSTSTIAWAQNEEPDPNEYLLDGTYGIYSWSSAAGESVTLNCTKYKIGAGTQLFSDVFSVGDYVNVTGTMYKLMDTGPLRIEAINDEANTITFADGTFRSLENLWCINFGSRTFGKGSHFVAYFQIEKEHFQKITVYCTKDISRTQNLIVFAKFEGSMLKSAIAWDAKAGEKIGDIVVVETKAEIHHTAPTQDPTGSAVSI